MSEVHLQRGERHAVGGHGVEIGSGARILRAAGCAHPVHGLVARRRGLDYRFGLVALAEASHLAPSQGRERKIGHVHVEQRRLRQRAMREPRDEKPVRSDTRIIGSNGMSVEAARESAAKIGFHASIWDSSIHGEARVLGERIGYAAGSLRETPGANLPACYVLGGETTVTVKGDGVGGRNTELALAAAIALEDKPRVALMTLATDGVDGSSQDRRGDARIHQGRDFEAGEGRSPRPWRGIRAGRAAAERASRRNVTM